MVPRIPNESSLNHADRSYFDLSPRRSGNAACRDVQATLSSFRFTSRAVGTAESPLGGAPLPSSTISLPATSEDEYVEPSCLKDASSRRPSVQRTSSAPEPSSSKSTLFVEQIGPSVMRPTVARACSESRASGVLERRRRKVASSLDALPTTLMLDLANLPMTMGAGNLGLLRAARKAISEPSGFDWGRSIATSAPSTASNSRFSTLQQQQRRSESSPYRASMGASRAHAIVSSPPSTSASVSASPESSRTAKGLTSSRSCVGSHWSNRTSVSDESEWDWALAGNARASFEALRYSAYKETREPVHDIWQQLPDWMCRRSSLGGRDADLSLRGPGLHNSFASPHNGGKERIASTPALAATLSLSQRSPRGSIAGRGRGNQAKLSMHVASRVVEEMPPHAGAISPRASFVGARDHASDQRRSRSAERGAATTA